MKMSTETRHLLQEIVSYLGLHDQYKEYGGGVVEIPLKKQKDRNQRITQIIGGDVMSTRNGVVRFETSKMKGFKELPAKVREMVRVEDFVKKNPGWKKIEDEVQFIRRLLSTLDVTPVHVGPRSHRKDIYIPLGSQEKAQQAKNILAYAGYEASLSRAVKGVSKGVCVKAYTLQKERISSAHLPEKKDDIPEAEENVEAAVLKFFLNLPERTRKLLVRDVLREEFVGFNRFLKKELGVVHVDRDHPVSMTGREIVAQSVGKDFMDDAIEAYLREK